MESPAKPELLIVNRQRTHTIDSSAIRAFLRQIVRSLDVTDRSFSVVFITDAAIRVYNRDYRGFDKATARRQRCEPFLFGMQQRTLDLTRKLCISKC